MNPMAVFKIRELLGRFEKNHPKFIPFCKAAADGGMEVGTVIEVTVTRPDGKSICSNIKITQDDLDLVEEAKRLAMEQS